MLLFGPPGTATALEKAIAARLGWAFVEVDPRPIALNPERLRRLFEGLFRGGCHQGRRVRVPGEFGATGHAMLVEAADGGVPARSACLERTQAVPLWSVPPNYVRLLDPALLRPGRFDLVIPVGLPDSSDRRALLASFLANRHCGAIDAALVVERSTGLTTADLAAVCQRAAQRAFEREVQRPGTAGSRRQILLDVLATYRPTVTPEDAAAFGGRTWPASPVSGPFEGRILARGTNRRVNRLRSSLPDRSCARSGEWSRLSR